MDHQPVISGPDRSRTDHTDLARISRLHRHAGPNCREVRPGVEPDLRPYHGRVQPEHLQTFCYSDPGWNRTITLLVVTQASSPLGYGIISDRGGRRTHKIATFRAPTLRWSVTALPVCVLGRKWRVRGSHPAVRAYEAPMSTGPPAASCRSRYRTGQTDFMKVRWAPAASASRLRQ